MGTGWRRARSALGLAVCTSIPRDPEALEKQQSPNHSPSPSPRSCANLGLLSSNSSTPRLQSQPVSNPRLRCKTTTTTSSSSSTNSPRVHSRSQSQSQSPRVHTQTQTRSQHQSQIPASPRLQCKTTKTPRIVDVSNPSSPKSPSRFALFKTSLRLSKSSCGVCLQSMKTGQGTAIYTAECSHAFHFHCIAAHVKKQGCLVCPVCRATWREVPLLPIHTQQQAETQDKTHQTHRQEQSNPPEPRVYDDDEPLIRRNGSGGARFFNPIPEAQEEEEEEEEEEEIEEFKGFVVNPTGEMGVISNSSNRSVQVKVLPESAVVNTGKSHESYAVVLLVKAPPVPAAAASAPLLDPACRAPIDLVTVLDVSGSMSGAKLQMLKRAMRLVISSLGASDRLSIVAFSSSSKRLLPLRRMSIHGQRLARRVVDRLGCGQGTSVGEALKKAAKVLEDRRERNPVASIMLLSDGQDERSSASAVPASSRRTRTSSLTRFGHLEIPVHAFGFGNDHQEPAEDAFAKCVGGLLSVVVQDLRLQIQCSSGAGTELQVSTVYSYNNRPTILYNSGNGHGNGNGNGLVWLGDLYAEEEREILIELKQPLAHKLTGSSNPHHMISIRACYKDPVSQELVHCNEQSLLIPVPHRSASPKIERLRNRFLTTRAVAHSRQLVELGEISGALNMLTAVRSALLQSSSISADEQLRLLHTEITELHWRRQQQQQQQQQQQRRRSEQDWISAVIDENGEPLTPTSAWRAAERLAKLAIMRKSLNRVSDLHGFENARF